MTDKLDYKALNTQLEVILAELQNSELDVDQAIKLYEQGTKISKLLQAYLKTAENKVTSIQAKG